MSRFTLLSPAKLNLFLHITGRRPDGYHELQTIFQLLNYGDTLTFEIIDSTFRAKAKIELLSDCKKIKTHDNLITQAAQLLQEHAKTPKNILINLKKIIPLGGGLGGGSSNAATTLLALNKLWNCELNLQQLAAIGLKLGADVPVFIYGQTSWAEGIGEILTPLAQIESWYLVLTPSCHASTPEIFSHEQLTRNTSPIKIAAFEISSSQNDCESVAILLYPEIENALKWLAQYAPTRMTGTGASIFASFSSKEEAVQVLKKLPDNVKGFVAQGINNSPGYKAFNK